jgi:predicted N-acetyltransferase YhbS
MIFRTAEPADVADLVSVINEAYRREGGWTTEAHLLDGQRIDAAAVMDALDTLIVAVDEQVVGCCALAIVNGHGHFGTFAVRQDLQGSGVGAALLTEAERRAAQAGAVYVEMTVLSGRAELLAFYSRRGYVATGDSEPFPYGDERFGLPRTADLEFVVLRKPLPA